MKHLSRIVAALALVAIVAGCSNAGAVAPPQEVVQPTPQIIYVTPDPVVQPVAVKPTATPAPTPEPTIEPEPEPEPTVEPITDDFVALGTWATIGDWKVRVTKVDWDNWPEQKRANMFNDKAPAGMVYVAPYIEYQYLGEGREAFDPMGSLYAVGVGGVEYDQYSDPSCGVLPEPDVQMADPTLRNGGKAKGWICFAVEKADAKSLIMFLDPMFEFDDESYTEFALR